MEVKEYTVIESAKLLNITRQSVYNKLNSLKDVLHPHVKTKNKTKYLTEKAIEIIRRDLNKEYVVKDKLYNDVNESLTDMYKNQIDDLHKTIDTIKEIYENQVKSMKEDYIKQIEYIKKESLEKNKQLENKDRLLENMQVLIKEKDEKMLLLEKKKQKKWWHFKK